MIGKGTCAKTTPAKTPETASKVIATTADDDDDRMIIYDDPMKLRTELQKDQITQYHDGYNAKKPESL